MADKLVVDASVVSKWFFEEAQSDRANALIESGPPLIAPDLLRWELASIAMKRVARFGDDAMAAREAVETLGDYINEFASGARLAPLALQIALQTGCSAYDSAYLALAEEAQTRVVTADLRLATRAEAGGLGFLIQRL